MRTKSIFIILSPNQIKAIACVKAFGGLKTELHYTTHYSKNKKVGVSKINPEIKKLMKSGLIR